MESLDDFRHVVLNVDLVRPVDHGCLFKFLSIYYILRLMAKTLKIGKHRYQRH